MEENDEDVDEEIEREVEEEEGEVGPMNIDTQDWNNFNTTWLTIFLNESSLSKKKPLEP